MGLRLRDIRRVAAEVAREEDPALQVLAATNGEGATDYTEVILKHERLGNAPSRVVVGVRRNASESQIRNLLRERLRDHLEAV